MLQSIYRLTFSDLQSRKTEVEAELHRTELPHVSAHICSRQVTLGITHSEGDVHRRLLLTLTLGKATGNIHNLDKTSLQHYYNTTETYCNTKLSIFADERVCELKLLMYIQHKNSFMFYF